MQIKIEPNSFAHACIEQNTLEELREARLYGPADEADCRVWGLTPEQWKQQLEQAIAYKESELT
jgi:hypothetical protein